jgi:hypothetical protein
VIPRGGRQRGVPPPPRATAVRRADPSGVRQTEAVRRPASAAAPACQANQASVGEWQALRQHLATCWAVPEGTAGSSLTLRFMISSAGDLRGPPMITATNVVPKEMSARYRGAALAVVGKCLPVCPTAEFGAILHDTVLHLRLVNDAPFPSRNLGPWMTIFSGAPR